MIQTKGEHETLTNLQFNLQMSYHPTAYKFAEITDFFTNPGRKTKGEKVENF